MTDALSTSKSLQYPPLRENISFRYLYWAGAISSAGNGVRIAALPLLTLAVTRDPVAVAGVTIANRLPWAIVTPFSGAIADRYDRKTLLISMDLLRGLLVALLAATILLHGESLLVIYAMALLLGVAETIFSSSSQGILPEVVNSDDLLSANSRIFTTQMVGSTFFGPMIGSWIYSLGRAVPFIFDALSFFGGCFLLRKVEVRRAPTKKKSKQSLLADIKDGLSWIGKRPVMRSFTLIAGVVNFTQSATQSVLVLLVVNDLGTSVEGYGFVLAAEGVGAFLGGMLSAKIGKRLGVHNVLLPGIVITCPLFLITGYGHSAFLIAAMLSVNAFAGFMVNVQMGSLRQMIVPGDFRSRVASVNMWVAMGIAVPAGSLAGGLIAQWTSTRMVYIVSAVIVGFLSLAIFRSIRPRALSIAVAELKEAQG
ncbi:MFS transporter [Streptomyces sp. NPDC001107]